MSQLHYGLIGNGQVSALIDQFGKMIWACLPDPQSPSVFAHLLDDKQGGVWEFEAFTQSAAKKLKFSQEYIKNTAVLSTRVILDERTEFQIIDFAPRYVLGRSHYRPAQLIRVLKPSRGAPEILMRFRPKLNYGLTQPHWKPGSGYLGIQGAPQELYLSTPLSLNHILEETPFKLDAPLFFVLSDAQALPHLSLQQIYDELECTVVYWRRWCQSMVLPTEFQREVIRSAITLKLHCFESTGAILAASTTSIPEGPEPGRTWDYRYCWLRDAYFVISAFYQLGKLEEIEGFLKFFLNVWESEERKVLQPVYGIRGEKKLIETQIPHLRGFHGLGPVRVGNAAYSMKQLDVYGEMLLALSMLFFDERTQKLNRRYLFEVINELASFCKDHFNEADAGIWEFRGTHRHFLFSKLMMWAGVFQGSKVAERLGIRELSRQWRAAAHSMSETIHAEGWKTQLGYFSQAYDNTDADAANLLFPYLGFMRDQDPKLKKMIRTYAELLRHGRGVFRYRSADDFGVPKTSFIVCSFWMAEALFRVGEVRGAKTVFKDAVSCSNPLGLLSEDFDPLSGELWGNFPQCYSHAGLIHAAYRMFQDDRRNF